MHIYAQLLNCIQMSPEDVEGVSTALAEEISAYPDINPYFKFRPELEVKDISDINETYEKWCARNLPILVPPSPSSVFDDSTPSSALTPNPLSVPDDSTPSSALKSTDADSSQPAQPASVPEKSMPSSHKSTSVPDDSTPSSALKSTDADSSQPAQPASVPEKSMPSSHKSTSSQPADSSQPAQPASVPEKSTDKDLNEFLETTMRGLVSKEMRVSSLKSTDADSSLASAKVRYCFAFSSQSSSFNSSFKLASTSDALPSSSVSKPKPASVSNKSTEAYSSLASAKVCNSFATLSHNSFFTSSFKHDSTSEALTSKSSTTKPTDAESFVASAKVRYSFAISSHNSSFTSSSSSSHTTKPKPSAVTYNLNVLQSDLIGHQGMTMYEQRSSNSTLFDFIEEEKVILMKQQMVSYPWSDRILIDDG